MMFVMGCKHSNTRWVRSRGMRIGALAAVAIAASCVLLTANVMFAFVANNRVAIRAAYTSIVAALAEAWLEVRTAVRCIDESFERNLASLEHAACNRLLLEHTEVILPLRHELAAWPTGCCFVCRKNVPSVPPPLLTALKAAIARYMELFTRRVYHEAFLTIRDDLCNTEPTLRDARWLTSLMAHINANIEEAAAREHKIVRDFAWNHAATYAVVSVYFEGRLLMLQDAASFSKSDVKLTRVFGRKLLNDCSHFFDDCNGIDAHENFDLSVQSLKSILCTLHDDARNGADAIVEEWFVNVPFACKYTEEQCADVSMAEALFNDVTLAEFKRYSSFESAISAIIGCFQASQLRCMRELGKIYADFLEDYTHFINDSSLQNVIGKECPICLNSETQSDNAVCTKMPCGHLFHAQCIKRWFCYSFTCPVCRKQFKFRFQSFYKGFEYLLEKLRNEINSEILFVFYGIVHKWVRTPLKCEIWIICRSFNRILRLIKANAFRKTKLVFELELRRLTSAENIANLAASLLDQLEVSYMSHWFTPDNIVHILECINGKKFAELFVRRSGDFVPSTETLQEDYARFRD